MLSLPQEGSCLAPLPAAQVIGRTVRELIPGLEQSWIERYGRVALPRKMGASP